MQAGRPIRPFAFHFYLSIVFEGRLSGTPVDAATLIESEPSISGSGVAEREQAVCIWL
jgi:hypothetical protein